MNLNEGPKKKKETESGTPSLGWGSEDNRHLMKRSLRNHLGTRKESGGGGRGGMHDISRRFARS